MTESNQSNNEPLTNPGVDFERSDVRIGWLGGAAFILLILVIIGMIISFWLLGAFETRRANVEPTPLPLIELRPTPPPPRLQPNPIDQKSAEEELRELRAREETMLNNYGWINREAGTARIPIERAMELMAEEAPPDDDEPAR